MTIGMFHGYKLRTVSVRQVRPLQICGSWLCAAHVMHNSLRKGLRSEFCTSVQRNYGRNDLLSLGQNKNGTGLFAKEAKCRSRFGFSKSGSIWKSIKSSSVNQGLRNRSYVYHDGMSLLCPIFMNAEKHQKNVAIIDKVGTLTYADILKQAMLLSTEIIHNFSNDDERKLNGQRIALLTENDACYVIGQFATWLADGVSVPMCQDHPVSMWEYFLENSECSLVLTSKKFSEKILPAVEKLRIPLIVLTREIHEKGDAGNINQWSISNSISDQRSNEEGEPQELGGFGKSVECITNMPALIVYTSGTTGRPKGVVLTHGNLAAMVSGMMESWAWTKTDVILHVLPLHHVHGIINCLLTPLACGATCVMEPKFDAERVWNVLTQPLVSNYDRTVNLFMAVPTIYAKLIEYFDDHIATGNTNLTAAFVQAAMVDKIRLMVSGSAALPSPVSDRWFEITGHRLLERYGMTEVGMALTNPLHGERIPGAVGMPFPNVEVRIVKSIDDSSVRYKVLAEGNSNEAKVIEGCEGESGELLVKGPSVFKEYWKNQETTAKSFTKDGWFKTGDTAVYADGVFRIIGRTSVDIIKNGGYKISALDVERHLLAHPYIVDCALVGLPDTTWGQKVASVLAIKDGGSMEVSRLREWAKDYLAPYQMPTVVKCLPTIPRNAMGKVNKKELVRQVFPEFLDDNQH